METYRQTDIHTHILPLVVLSAALQQKIFLRFRSLKFCLNIGIARLVEEGDGGSDMGRG